MSKLCWLTGDIFSDTVKDLKRMMDMRPENLYRKYGEKGVEILSQLTPKYTGLASSSWSYDIETTSNITTITWCNNDIENGYNVIILIRYGHGLDGGGYVRGRDFIDPAMQPIFDEFVKELWKEVCGK